MSCGLSSSCWLFDWVFIWALPQQQLLQWRACQAELLPKPSCGGRNSKCRKSDDCTSVQSINQSINVTPKC